jgi:hypothetical protein
MPTATLAELSAKLAEQGVTAEPLCVASALLGLARVKGWTKLDGTAAVLWLEQLASEVLKASGPEPCPILDELEERLNNNAASANPRKVASALLGIATEEQWNTHAEHMIDWFARTAIEVARHGGD